MITVIGRASPPLDVSGPILPRFESFPAPERATATHALASTTMRYGPRLTQSFYERPCATVARELVGCVLVHAPRGGPRLSGLIVEVEAYLGDGSDEASHSNTGSTLRNASMFGPPGQLYTYRSYGIHTCANLVCEPTGMGAAVLLRAAMPLEGEAEMRRRRRLADDRGGRWIASGPGRLAEAFGLSLEHDGTSALAPSLCVHAPAPGAEPGGELAYGPRVGISKGAELPYRFFLRDHPHVSPWRPGKPARTKPATRSAEGG
jgi:DNA-3-methyladenine glycosylase